MEEGIPRGYFLSFVGADEDQLPCTVKSLSMFVYTTVCKQKAPVYQCILKQNECIILHIF